MINNTPESANSSFFQFILASTDFPIMSRLELGSLLALACNRELYKNIQNYLLQERSVPVLKYQKSRVIKSFFDLQTVSDAKDMPPFLKLKHSTLSKSMMRNWVERKDLTTEMRFYGLLHGARLSNLDHRDTQILETLFDRIKNNTIELPYILPFISESIQKKWFDTLVFDTLPKESSNNFVLFWRINSLFFSIFSRSLFAKLSLEEIQVLFVKFSNEIKDRSTILRITVDDRGDYESSKEIDQHEINSQSGIVLIAFTMLTILIPYLEPKQIREVLHLVEMVTDASGKLRSAADATLVAIAPYLSLNEIEQIVDRKLGLAVGDSSDVSVIANQFIAILCPYLSPGKIADVLNSTIKLINKPLIFAHLYESQAVVSRLAALLPHLQVEQVEHFIEKSPKLLNGADFKSFPHLNNLSHANQYSLLSLLLFHLNSDQLLQIMVQGLSWLKKEDTAIFMLKEERLIKRLSDLDAERIQEMVDIIVKEPLDYNQTILYLNPYTLSVFLPNLRVNQIKIVLGCIINRITADQKTRCAQALVALTEFLDYVPTGETQRIFNLVFQLVREEENPPQEAFTLLEALLPRVQIPPELLKLLALDESLSKKQAALVGLLAYHLPPKEIKQYLGFSESLRQENKGNISLVGYKILHAAADQLQSDEIRKLLPEIHTFIKTEYEKPHVQNINYANPYHVQIVVKLFSTLSQFLPQLSQDEIISVLPPIGALWNNQAGDPRAIALANFIEKVIPLINYETISDELFLNHPLLFLMKIMHDCKENIASRPNESVSCSNFGQSPFFQQPNRIHNKRVNNTALDQEAENKPRTFNR